MDKILLNTTYLIDNIKSKVTSISIDSDGLYIFNDSKDIKPILLQESDFTTNEDWSIVPQEKGLSIQMTKTKPFSHGSYKVTHNNKDYYMSYLHELEQFRIFI